MFCMYGRIDQPDQRVLILPVQPIAPGASSVVVESRAEHAVKQG